MKIELKHEVELNGKEWYHIYVDGIIKESKTDLDEAFKLYKIYVENAKNGYPAVKIVQVTNI